MKNMRATYLLILDKKVDNYTVIESISKMDKKMNYSMPESGKIFLKTNAHKDIMQNLKGIEYVTFIPKKISFKPYSGGESAHQQDESVQPKLIRRKAKKNVAEVKDVDGKKEMD